MPAARRNPLPDALRALALMGVLLVNGIGYPTAPYGALLGPPPQTPWDSFALLMVATFVQGKAYPFLACLFGMSLVWATHGRSRPDAQRRFVHRQMVLLVLGVMHGAFIYFGDILTLYVVTAWTVWSSVRVRLHVAVQRLRHALLWCGLSIAGMVGLAWLSPAIPDSSFPGLAGARSATEVVMLNLNVYVSSNAVGLLLIVPVLRLCMLAGVVGARLRLLTHRRWASWRAGWCKRLGLPLLAANIVYGWSVVMSMMAGQQHLHWADALSPLVGLPLAALYALTLAQRASSGTWVRWLAPLGRRTLSVYLGHSLVCLVLFSGLGFAWSPGAAAIAAGETGLWLILMVAAWCLPRTWPAEWLLGRGR